MRLATLLLGLVIGALLTVLTFIMFVADQDELAAGGDEAWAEGMFFALTLLWVLAVVVVLPRPLWAMLVFDAAAMLAGVTLLRIDRESADNFAAVMVLWLGASLVLALLSFFGWRARRAPTV